MIDLAHRAGPYEIALPYGLTVTVRSLTTASMAAAQAAARRAVEAIERQARERTGAGLTLDELPRPLSREGARWLQSAWRFLRFQRNSALAQWFHERTTDGRRNTRKTMIVALARKLLIALWRLVTTGEVPEGVVLRPAS